MEDLDAAVSRPEHEATQLRDLTMLGIDWDGPVLRQSDRRSVHEDAIGRLQAAGRTYRCYCTRREIHAAASAPHGPGPEGAYPGTCLSLTMKERAEREADGRRPALRLAAGAAVVRVTDTQCGVIETVVDDFVLQRSDGVPAYNLAVVVDDAAQGVEQVVRGDDLLSSAPRQAFLGTLLGLAPVAYAHVPLVLGPDGRRLAKRDGAVTLAERLDQGETVEDVVLALLASCGIDTQEVRSPLVALAVFRPSELTRAPWVVDPGRPLRGQHRPLG